MRFVLAAPLFLAALVTGSANATPTQTSFAADTFTFTADCAYDAAHTGCDSLSNYREGTRQWSPAGANSSISDERGSSWTLAQADAGSYLPVLKAYAASNTDYQSSGPHGGTSMADATIWAVQGYRYTGSTPFTLTVTATLESQFAEDAGGGTQNHSLVALSLFGTENYSFSYNPGAQSGSSCPITSSVPRPGCATLPAIHAQELQFLYDSGTLTVSISTTLTQGQTFYVGAMLDANVCCGGIVDSSHTLRMAFNDATNLESFQVAVVPEPAEWAMLAAGLALVGLRRRRAR